MIPDAKAPEAASGLPALARRAMPVAAAGLALLRGSGLPMTDDPGFHLIRAGNSLLRGSLQAWNLPPGGTQAPPLSSLATAFGAMFTEDPEHKLMVTGCVVLALAAAWVVRTLLRAAGPLAAALGLAFLLLPPGTVAGFNERPDAALGGLLLAVAWDRSRRGESAGRILAPAWLAVPATAWAVPAALVLHATQGMRAVRSRSAWAAPAGVLAAMTAFSAALATGRHGEAFRYLLEESGPSPRALASSIAALGTLWGGGLLLLPLVPGAGGAPLPRRFLLPIASAFVVTFVLAAPGRFAEATALFAPGVALCAGLSAVPTASTASDRRRVLLAFLLPLFVLLVGGGAVGRRQRDLRAAALRNAQIGATLGRPEEPSGAIAATQTGALAALSDRVVHPLPADGLLPEPLPRWIVFSGGRDPGTPAEIATFESGAFLASYAPWEIRRGRSLTIPDVIWVRRDPPVSPVPDASYARALREAWTAGSAGDTARFVARLEDAVRAEPKDLGLAREALGVQLERGGDAERSFDLLSAARGRDIATILARAHLADRALSAGEIQRADSLLSETFRVRKDWGALRGLRARLFAEAGYAAEAEHESAEAVLLDPANARVLVNHGILLWRRGAVDEAREIWARALLTDPSQRRYLGDFEHAKVGTPSPPLRPLFTDAGFHPGPPPATARPPGGPAGSLQPRNDGRARH